MSFFVEIKKNYTISALLCVLIGLVLVIWPGTSTRVVCMLLGGVLLVYGLVQILVYVFSRERTLGLQGMLVLGIIFAVIGGWIILRPDLVIAAIPIIVGVLIAIHGLHNITQAIGLKKSGYDKWWLALIFAILTIALGGILIYNPFTVIDTLVRLIGIFLIYDGLSDVWILSRMFSVKKRADVIDAEYVDVEET